MKFKSCNRKPLKCEESPNKRRGVLDLTWEEVECGESPKKRRGVSDLTWEEVVLRRGVA